MPEFRLDVCLKVSSGDDQEPTLGDIARAVEAALDCDTLLEPLECVEHGTVEAKVVNVQNVGYCWPAPTADIGA